jgi:plasmid stabilization system protein ParE
VSRRPKAVRWHAAARDDVLTIVGYIADDSPRAAADLADRFDTRVALLSSFPYLGEICPDYRRARFLVEGKYVIYYTVHRHEVVVRAVVHGARLFRRSWLRREE